MASAAAGAGSGSDAAFLLGGALWLVAGSVALVWFSRAQRAYLRLYRERLDPPFPLLPEELAAPYLRRPARWFVEAPGLLWRLRRVGREPHADPVVEAARRRASRRWWVMAAVVFVGVALPIIASLAAST